MDWDKLRIFHAVADAGSFTHAGQDLHLSQSAVSRQISHLEESLKVPLFHRHARGLILTEQGELLRDAASEIFTKLATTEALLSESREEAMGPLRVTTTIAFGSTWLAPRLGRFLDLYPEINLSLIVVDNDLDLSMRQADVGIRMAPPRQPDLIQRHLKTIHFHIYASRYYLETHGTPQTIADLAEHRVILYGETSRPPFPNVNWLVDHISGLAHSPTITPIKINNFYGIYRAVENGAGVALLPDYLCREDPNLVRVFEDLEGPPVSAYFVYPEELRNAKKIKVFRDFLLEEVADSTF